MTQEQAQNRINEVQETYREWLSLYEKLEQAHQDFIKSNELMQKMEQFYFGGEYREIFEKIEKGEKLDLTTKGEYSIMSEDTLWNAFHDQQTLLWKFLRIAVKELDKENSN